MKRTIVLFLIFLAIPPFLFSADLTAAGQEFKSIQEVLKDTTNLMKDDTKKETLKYVRKQLVRVHELWDQGYVPNSLTLLMNVRSILYRSASGESDMVQQNLKSVMRRLWPFLLKSGRFRSDIQTFQGVVLVSLIVPEGRFLFSIPEDARPQETVSGGVQAFPENLASLYLLTIAGTPIVPDRALRRWNLPQSFDLILTDMWGNEVIHINQRLSSEPSNNVEASSVKSSLPSEKQPREVHQNIEIPYLRFQISARVKAGEHLIVEGPFDGDFSTTLAGIGKFQAQIVAESPRRLVLWIHPRMTGPWTILIKENENRVRCKVEVQSEAVDPFATLSTCTPP
jgi:hypothetical protein